MHLKRQKSPTSWPIKRKGTAYVIKPKVNLDRGIPILVALRDILGVAQNKKEVKKAIHEGKILLNTRPVHDEKDSLVLFDILSIPSLNKIYLLTLSERGKFILKEIKEDNECRKVSKIIGKKILRGKKIQLNLNDGRNYLSDIKCNLGDSVLINLRDRKIVRCLPLKEKANIFIFAGKHSGKEGVIEKIKPERKMAKVIIGGNSINVLIKQIMVIE